MSLRPKLIIFDIGGVLIEYGSVFVTPAREQKIPHEFLDKTFDKYDYDVTIGKITPQELYLNCLRDYNIDADPGYDFASAWIKDYEPIKESYDLISKLAGHFDIGLLSNIYKGLVPKMITQKLIPDINYRYMFLSCELGVQKPDPKIYEHVMSNANLIPEQILYIDDKLDYLEYPKTLKWNTFHFPRYDPKKGVSELTTLLM